MNLKNIKIAAVILAFSFILSVFLLQSCTADTNTDDNAVVSPSGESNNSNNPSDLTSVDNSEYERRLNDIVEQCDLYEPFYVTGDEVTENLKSAIRDAREILAENAAGLSGNSEYIENIEIASVKINEASGKFRSCYIYAGGENNQNANLIDNLYIDGTKCGYDEKSRTFYYTMGKTPDKELKFYFNAENSQNTKVFAEIYSDSTLSERMDYKFIPELNKAYTLKAYAKDSQFDYTIIFTMLPIIQIDNIDDIRDNYRDCTISVTDPDFMYTGYGSLTHSSTLFFKSTAKIHIRGGIARGFPKKSYALKFVDNNGANKDAEFFGLRKSSDWILDAMYIDKARARNRITTDVWHDIDSPLYYMTDDMKPQTNGTRGVFVEVFLNNEYMGLYCFTEKIDRKQLQLLKNEENEDGNVVLRSLIYKGYTWDEPILFRQYRNFKNTDWAWGGFEQKYPRPENGGQIDWSPIAKLVDFGVNSTDEDFAANIDKYIDVDNFVDYTILMCITFAYDNTGKNAYWSVFDITDENLSKMFITPWDMDATWGGSWEGSKLAPDIAWMDSEYEHDSHFFRRLILTNAGGFADKLRVRWEELKNNVLSPKSLYGRFETYFDLFDASGAWERESRRWRECGLDLEGERVYVNRWISDRWDYIDDFITSKLDTVGDFAASPPRRRGR